MADEANMQGMVIQTDSLLQTLSFRIQNALGCTSKMNRSQPSTSGPKSTRRDFQRKHQEPENHDWKSLLVGWWDTGSGNEGTFVSNLRLKICLKKHFDKYREVVASSILRLSIVILPNLCFFAGQSF